MLKALRADHSRVGSPVMDYNYCNKKIYKNSLKRCPSCGEPCENSNFFCFACDKISHGHCDYLVHPLSISNPQSYINLERIPILCIKCFESNYDYSDFSKNNINDFISRKNTSNIGCLDNKF